MTKRTLEQQVFLTGCILTSLSVLFGAFGAHFLKSRLTPDELVTFETGIRYQIIHSLGLVMMGLSHQLIKPDVLKKVFYLMVFGVCIFSGSLYFLSLKSMLGFSPAWKVIGAITPLGGLSFMVSWIYLGWSGLKRS